VPARSFVSHRFSGFWICLLCCVVHTISFRLGSCLWSSFLVSPPPCTSCATMLLFLFSPYLFWVFRFMPLSGTDLPLPAPACSFTSGIATCLPPASHGFSCRLFVLDLLDSLPLRSGYTCAPVYHHRCHDLLPAPPFTFCRSLPYLDATCRSCLSACRFLTCTLSLPFLLTAACRFYRISGFTSAKPLRRFSAVFVFVPAFLSVPFVGSALLFSHCHICRTCRSAGPLAGLVL